MRSLCLQMGQIISWEVEGTATCLGGLVTSGEGSIRLSGWAGVGEVVAATTGKTEGTLDSAVVGDGGEEAGALLLFGVVRILSSKLAVG